MYSSTKQTVHWFVFLLLAASLHSCRAGALKTSVDHFPGDADLVVYSRSRQVAYCALGSEIIACKLSGEILALRTLGGELNSIVESEDGKNIIARSGHKSWVLSSDKLTVKRKITTASPWWEKTGAFHYDSKNGTPTRLRDGTDTRDHNWDVIGSDATGAYYMCIREINSGDNSNGNCPLQRLELWQHMKGNGLRQVGKLMNIVYDPGSEDAPTHLAVLNDHTVVFGTSSPLLGESIGVLLNGRARSLRDEQRRQLVFCGNPIITPGSIVGIARAIDQDNESLSQKYLYVVSGRSVKVMAVPTDTVLVTYKSHYGVGIGTCDGGDYNTTVTYNSVYVRQ